MDTLFDVQESTPGLIRITPEMLFSSWELYIREDVIQPENNGKPFYQDVCHKHVGEVITRGYVYRHMYDYGFGSCDVCP
jgi:hypothetical protein